ncbi:MAG TPA: 23S rRNA (adenine(2503)-C(2))-methyltransferase RlmN [Planctomycetaceae bacterium]|nr:23S rRNA (adenine(2503)-C(2))-methyltransferase RlmN [Planctomycetaceae bacterium]
MLPSENEIPQTSASEASMLPLITDLTRDQLAEWCIEHGSSSYRADQIRRWIFTKRVNDFDAMHDISKKFRDLLKENYRLFSTRIVKHQTSRDRTEKLLLELHDGHHVECVLMREPKRNTVCISTQVGCAMGCVFCASGLLGLTRNLTMGEILEQILRLDRVIGEEERISNIVVMGIGEPLANLSALIPALDTLNHKGGMGIGARKITVSTVGLPVKIRELADVNKSYILAVSLHAPNDTLRDQIVPTNNKIGIQKILDATDYYYVTTGRRGTFEYILLAGVNDSPAQAHELACLLKHRNAHVNLIPANGVQETGYQTPTTEAVDRFFMTLAKGGVNVTVRKRKGDDIDAACGQLRLNREKEKDLVQIQ